MCLDKLHVLSTSTSPCVIQTVKCQVRVLTVVCLLSGMLTCVLLTLSIVFDYWLLTKEPVRHTYFDQDTEQYTHITMLLDIHTGLWRGCFYYQTGKYLGVHLDRSSLREVITLAG